MERTSLLCQGGMYYTAYMGLTSAEDQSVLNEQQLSSMKIEYSIMYISHASISSHPGSLNV
jgi:hypothetical protein